MISFHFCKNSFLGQDLAAPTGIPPQKEDMIIVDSKPILQQQRNLNSYIQSRVIDDDYKEFIMIKRLIRSSVYFAWLIIFVTSGFATARLPLSTHSIAPAKQSAPFKVRYSLAQNINLPWNTFLGGPKNEEGYSVAVDASGNIYLAGESDGTWGNPVRASSGYDAFVAKLDPSGNLIWNTFLGGSYLDTATALVVDGNGNVYVAGSAFTTWGNPIRPFTSGSEAFIAKLDAASGSLIWNTFLGGIGNNDTAYALAVDTNGDVYTSGVSLSTWGNPQRAYTGSADAFAARLDPSGNLVWNTFLGEGGLDYAYSIAVDASENVYLAGNSNGTWGNPVRAYSGGQDAYAAKLDAAGNLVWNTFLGAKGAETNKAVAVDASGNVFVAGYSSDWGTNPIRAYTPGDWDAFVAKLNNAGVLQWHTFLGGGAGDNANALALDSCGNPYVTGSSFSSWGNPTQPFTAVWDTFAARLDTSGNLTWNTFMGGNWIDYGNSIALDGNRNVIVAGSSSDTWGNPVLPYAGIHDTMNTYKNAFVANVIVPHAPAAINVKGNGISIPASDPTPSIEDDTDFGSAILKGETVDHTFRIENTGDTNLTLTGAPEVSIDGENASDFRVVAQPVSPVAGGCSTTFTVRFSPSAPGVRTASINIANDADDEHPYQFNVQGMGMGDTAQPDVVSFAAPSISSSLDIPINAFTSSDNVAVTGYIITTSPDQPAVDAADWSETVPATYTVPEDGTYTLYPWVKDASGNLSSLFAGPVTVLVDTTAPTVTVEQAPEQTDPTSLAPINFSVLLSEPVTGFTADDVEISGTAGTTTATLTGSDTAYTIAIGGMNADGTVIVSIPAGKVQDIAGNTNTASTSTDNNVSYISSAPPVITEGEDTTVKMGEDDDESERFALTLHATDADADPLTWSILSQAKFGKSSVNANTGVVSYKPFHNYNGTDAFVVQVSDGNGGTDEITVHVIIKAEKEKDSFIPNQNYQIQYNTWQGVTDMGALGGGYRKAISGDFVFTPPIAFTQVSWIAYRGPGQGKASVLVDGVLKTTIDLYSATPHWQYPVEIKGLSNKKHTVIIRALNLKNPASSASWVVVDGFKINQNIYDENKTYASGTFVYGAWAGVPANFDPRFGGYQITGQANAITEFSFDGVQFTWLTARGPAYGKAAIYIDNVLIKTIDLYAASQQWLYKVPIRNLGYGHHTVIIKVLGTKNPSSVGTQVIENGFDEID